MTIRAEILWLPLDRITRYSRAEASRRKSDDLWEGSTIVIVDQSAPKETP